jgi:hypothetical protein
MIETKFQWIDALTTLCPLIGRLNLKAGKDIVYAERVHGILVSHNDAYNLSNSDVTVLARAATATDGLNGKLDAAQANGVLAFFNSEYRKRRLAARHSGKGFMSYGAARSRLTRTLSGAAATGSVPALMAAVFGKTRASARVVENQKTARCPARASP